MANRQRRAQSLDRTNTSGSDLAQLTTLLAQALNQPPAPREVFKAPEFDGSSDVEGFIHQFRDVSQANGWSDIAALLHIRAKLKGDARDCGHGESLHAVFSALRARYGMTNREARIRLANLRRTTQTTLQAHAMEVDRLVQLAYAGLPEPQRLEMAVELFCSTIGHTALQRHLLAVPTPDLESAVRAGNDYLQIQPANTHSHIKSVQPDELEQDAVNQLRPDQTTLPMGQLLKLMQDLTQEVQQLKIKMGRRDQKRTKVSGSCFGCGQEGHWRKDCTKKQTQRSDNSSTTPASGNGYGPQQ